MDLYSYTYIKYLSVVAGERDNSSEYKNLGHHGTSLMKLTILKLNKLIEDCRQEQVTSQLSDVIKASGDTYTQVYVIV